MAEHKTENMEETLLITGATGYVGGRLVPLLLNRGYKVRVFVRSAHKLNSRPWAKHENLEIAEGDCRDYTSLAKAMEGCGVLYYLIHSMSESGNFSATDRDLAYATVRALKSSSIKRIIYLSGIIPDDAYISPHLRSRAEVAEILALSEVPLTTLRAAQIIGVGSASFEMVRYLVDRLPILLAPQWVRMKTQPIAMSNVLNYLAGVLEHPSTIGETYDIGGQDIVTYGELLQTYAQVAGLSRRWLIPVPFMPLWLSSRLVGLITPVPTPLAKALMEGLRNEVVCKDKRIRTIIPQELFSVREAVGRALGRVRRNDVETSWFDAGMPLIPEWWAQGDPSYAGGSVFTDGFSIRLAATPEEIWQPIVRIGGETGWYSSNILWKLRGLGDRLMGGPGVQRGRRNKERLYVGDGLDFWRVLDVQPPHRLLLLTEMRMPGEGLLDLSILSEASVVGQASPAVRADASLQDAEGKANGTSHFPESELRLSLYFRPKGFWGRAYWYTVMPFHSIAFKGMLKAIAKRLNRKILSPPQRIKPQDLSGS